MDDGPNPSSKKEDQNSALCSFGKGGTTVSFSPLEASASLVKMLESKSKDVGRGNVLCAKPSRPTWNSHVSRL